MNLVQFQLIEQTNALYRKVTPLLLITSLTLYSITLFTLWFHHNVIGLIIWFIISITLLGLRQNNKQRFLTVRITLANYKRWLNDLLSFSFLLGLTWGLIFFFALDSGHLYELLVLTTIYFALVSTSSSSLGVYLPAYLTFVLPPTLFFITKLVLIGGQNYYIFAALIFFYFLFITSLARNTHAATRNVSELTFRNNSLFNDLVKQKELAEKAVTGKNRFLAAASHDLRQPLHAQGLFITGLEYSELSPEAKTLTHKIKTSNNVLSALLNDLLDISRLDAKQTEYKPNNVSLNSVIKKINLQYFDAAAEKECELKLDLHDNLYIYTDESLLTRMIGNLVDNAVKFTAKGKIIISTDINSDSILLTIADTGKGILEDQQQNVFTEFTQLNNPERDREKGLGLGLAIVKRISQVINVPINMQSKYGVGTTFTLTFKRISEDTQNNKITNTISSNTNSLLKNKTIVVIDDDVEILDGMEMILSQWLTNVITAENVQQAIKKVAKFDLIPDLIISDFRLRKGKTGIEAINQMRTRFNHPIAAILITGDTASQKLKIAQKADLALLYKPIDSKTLRLTLESILHAESDSLIE